MADLINEKITRGKIEFWRCDIIDRTPLSTIFKGTFEGRIPVAIKRFPLDLAKLAENEIDVLLLKTDHDNVIKYYDMGKDHDFCYIAMQLCVCNLEEYIEKKRNYLCHNLDLPDTPVEEILQGAAEGLSYIHKNDIIHRDIKPSNILLFIKENKLVAKISDFGISRIIPAHQTVLGNFSAGTDLYKAPELLTPAFSWRSDVYAFGLVIFYVLSKGKHLFNNNLGQIIKGNPVNLRELNGQPAALSLVKWLTAFNQEERPRMSEVVHHPFFWNDEKKLDFIRDVHQVIQDRQNAFLKEVIEEDSHHVICSSPENCGNQRTPPDPAACADWTCSLTPNVKADCGGKVNTNSCAELVRIIRNKLTHFYDLKEAVKIEYEGNIEGFRRYWLDRFPSLVVHLWEKVELTHLAALFSGYYAPESVRRRNVETTLLQNIDEGELGEPQELLNKVKQPGSKIWEGSAKKPGREHLKVLLKNVTVTDIERKDRLTTLLQNAMGIGLVEVAELLIKFETEVNCKDEDGSTPLHIAAKNGYLSVAQLLIKRGAEVNSRTKYGSTPLHEAAYQGHLSVVKFLIERGAEVNCKDEDGSTPLHEAAYEGHLDVLSLLIWHDAEVNSRTKYGSTPLHEAAYRGHIPVVEFLIERGTEVNCKDEDGSAPLHAAASKGHLSVVKLLIGHNAEVNSRTKYERTPLHEAAGNGHLNVAELLIEHGADVNYKNYTGWTPLHMAAYSGHLPVVELLVKRGSEVNCRNHTQSPLHVAAYKGHLPVVKLLIKLGADVNCEDKYGKIPLHSAASEDHLPVVKLLIELGAKVNCKDKNGRTPLHVAASKGHLAVAELLVEHGAEINGKDEDESTPLHVAAKNGHPEVTKLLIERGAEVNCKDKTGWTPLHVAAENGHLPVVLSLINRGAEVSCKNAMGYTPLDYATRKSRTEVIEFLRNFPAENLPREPEISYYAPESVRGKTEETTLLGKIDKGELGTGTGRSTAAERQQQQQQQPQQQEEDAAAVPKEDPQSNENREHVLVVQAVATPPPPLPMSPPIPEFIPAPEWASRKSVETSLVRKSDEGELGEHQEFLNKVKRPESKVNEGELSSAKKPRTEHLEDSPENMTVTDIEREDRLTTLLHNAAGYGRVEDVRLLIEHGAEVNCKDDDGSTPLDAAASKGHSEVVKLLVECGAEVNCKDENGSTPLHVAASKGHSEVVKLLVECGAEVNCKTEDGETPLDYAMKKSHTEVIQFLRNFPAESLSQEPEMTGMAEDVKKVPLVLENSDRTMKIGIAASTIEEIITKAKKLKLTKDDTKCSVFLSSDRKTELVDNDYLCSLEPNTRLIVLTENDIVEQNRLSTDEQDSGSTEGPWKPVFRKITQNLGLIALLGEDELEAIADEDQLTSLAGSDPEFFSWSAKDVEEIQEHCQKMLESKREIRQALDLVQLYKRSKEESEISNEQNGKPQ